MSAPRWAVGMRRFSPGIYLDQHGALHISEEEICRAVGAPLTSNNCSAMRELAMKAILQAFPGTPVSMVDEDEDGRLTDG